MINFHRLQEEKIQEKSEKLIEKSEREMPKIQHKESIQ